MRFKSAAVLLQRRIYIPGHTGSNNFVGYCGWGGTSSPSLPFAWVATTHWRASKVQLYPAAQDLQTRTYWQQYLWRRSRLGWEFLPPPSIHLGDPNAVMLFKSAAVLPQRQMRRVRAQMKTGPSRACLSRS
ncbi:hypothetical protein NDU88_005698 [Pleurodeles waltl]|uniref:Uncharacterized protein n=1 Tax=Pleurodeles waltl TaxID=8319 RepID=A0AAV7QLE5_PLEWA|nr:hypothetical protein NDU88_005698 [Pleurodeles waltl]